MDEVTLRSGPYGVTVGVPHPCFLVSLRLQPQDDVLRRIRAAAEENPASYCVCWSLSVGDTRHLTDAAGTLSDPAISMQQVHRTTHGFAATSLRCCLMQGHGMQPR